MDSAHYLDQLRTAVVIIDQDYLVQYLNAAAESFFQLSTQRIQQHPLQNLFLNPEEILDIVNDAIANKSAYIKRQVSAQLLTQQQTTFDFSVTPSGTILIIEINPLDRFIRISSEENIYQSQESIKSLIRGLSHEIKNPLAGIQGAAQLLHKKIKTQDIQEYTQVIIAEAKRLSHLVDRMLIPHKTVQFVSINIHEVVERVYHLLAAEIAQNEQLNVQLHRDYDPSIPDLIADKGQLIQAVLNISRNALEALSTQAHGNIYFSTRVLSSFTIGNKRYRLVCEINIKDDGPGIPEQIRDSLFLPMVTGRAEGSGLGLSIAQSIINQHQGLINFSSTAGATMFKIHIPID